MDEYLIGNEKAFLKRAYGYGTYKTKGYTKAGAPIVWRSESHHCKKCGEVVLPTKQRINDFRRGQLITRLALGYYNVHPQCDRKKRRTWKELAVG